MRRCTVLIFPLQLGFPAAIIIFYVCMSMHSKSLDLEYNKLAHFVEKNKRIIITKRTRFLTHKLHHLLFCCHWLFSLYISMSMNWICVWLIIDIERRKNRLLKFSYVPATSAAHNRLLFFSFFAAAVYSTISKQAGLKQSKFLDVYGINIDLFMSMDRIFMYSSPVVHNSTPLQASKRKSKKAFSKQSFNN